MFLALKEIKDAKLRYGLLTGIFLLISLVIFILAGLATGLSDGHKKAVADWQATGMVLNENANKIVNASNLSAGDLTRVSADKKAAVGFYSGALTTAGKDKTKDNVSVFGVAKDSFILPKVKKGHVFKENYQILISENLATQQSLKLGDKVKIGNLTEDLTVTGIIPATTYSVEPVVYTNLATYQALKFGSLPENDDEVSVNAFAFKAKDLNEVLLTQNKQTALEKMSTATFIANLPGYTAEKITLSMMVYILIFIAASILAIFMYVLTLQKKSLFGILKAQGVPTSAIAASILAQSLLMSFVGSALGLILALLLSQVFPASMPFTPDLATWSLYGLLLMGVGTLGGLFSLPSVLKVDPVVAIGG